MLRSWSELRLAENAPFYLGPVSNRFELRTRDDGPQSVQHLAPSKEECGQQDLGDPAETIK